MEMEEEPATPALKVAGCATLAASAMDSCEHTSIGHCGPDCGGGSHGGGDGVEAVSNARSGDEIAGTGHQTTPAAGLSRGPAVGGAYGASLAGSTCRGADQSEQVRAVVE